MKRNSNLTREALLNIPIPERTASYTPVSNRSIVELISKGIEDNGLILLREQYIGARDGSQVVGNLAFQYGDDPETGLRLAFKNSYDKSMAFGFCVGKEIFICANGMVSGEISLKRVHRGTADDDAYGIISEGFGQIAEQYQRDTNTIETLKSIPISMEQTSKLAGEMFLNEGFMSSLQMNIFKKELYESENFRKIDDNKFSAWDFYNHTTEALKQSHPTSFIKDHVDFHQFIESNVMELF